MDKITRMLLLHSKLTTGEKISKVMFCLETDCQPRSFDRDIEDYRLYLSETFSVNELLYDRKENSYYLSGNHRAELEITEYSLLERLLLDTGILRYDEMKLLLEHLASNTEDSGKLLKRQAEVLKEYVEPDHNKALLKMHGDLNVVIRNRAVINVKYYSEDGTFEEYEILPCKLKYKDNQLILVALSVSEECEKTLYYNLERIHSFKTVQSQLKTEQVRVNECLEREKQNVINNR